MKVSKSFGYLNTKGSFFDDKNLNTGGTLFLTLSDCKLKKSLARKVAEYILLERGESFGSHIERFITLSQKYIHVFEDREKIKY